MVQAGDLADHGNLVHRIALIIFAVIFFLVLRKSTDGSWVIVVSGGVSCCVLLKAGIFKLGFRLGCATKDWPLMQINDSRINT